MFDADFPQRFVQFIVDQQDVFGLDAVFTSWRGEQTYFRSMFSVSLLSSLCMTTDEESYDVCWAEDDAFTCLCIYKPQYIPLTEI